MWPKKRDVFEILRARAKLRLSGQRPKLRAQVRLQDVRRAADAFPTLRHGIKAIITSPPYFNTTNTEEDQWLRLWFLGHEPRPTYGQITRDDRHSNKSAYWNFLTEAWAGIAPLLRPDAVLVCRLGAIGMNEEELTRGLMDSIRRTFPCASLIQPPVRTAIRNRQTEAFRPGSSGCLFEVDYLFLTRG